MVLLDPKTTALVLIDLQKGIVARPTQPYPSDAVIRQCNVLITHFRQAGAPIVFTRVGWSAGLQDLPPQTVDQRSLPDTPPPAEFTELVPELTTDPGDVQILKHQWGAFYGTDLDLQLRRRHVKTIVLGGISTNFGVESTGRDAWERNYELLFVEDAMASAGAEMHQFAIKNIFPRIGRVMSTAQVVQTIQ